MPNFRLMCGEIVLRIIDKKTWLDNDGRVLSEAYLLWRKADAETGLSVRRACLCTVGQCKTKLNNGRGVDSLHTGHVSEMGLEIWQNDPAEEDHAGIVGLPHWFDKDNLTMEEINRAEDLASMLAEHSRRRSREAWRRNKP